MTMFSQRLKQARLNKGLTQTEVAKRIFVSQAAYSKYETGAASPNPETLAKLADVLEVTVGYLLEETNSPTSAPLTLDDFTFAMHNHSGQLTERDKQILLSLAQQLSEAHQQEEEGGKTDGD